MVDHAYDRFVEYYDGFVGGSFYRDIVLPGLRSILPPVAGLRICDVACGQGIVSRELAAQGASVVGVDLSGELLELARRNERQEPLSIDYLQDDARTLSTLDDGTPIRIIDRHLTEGFWRSRRPEGLRHRVGSHHRTLSTYLNALADAGFSLERVVEPGTSGGRAQEVPGSIEMPSAIFFRAQAVPEQEYAPTSHQVWGSGISGPHRMVLRWQSAYDDALEARIELGGKGAGTLVRSP